MRQLLLLGTLLLLAGCAARIPVTVSPEDWAARDARLLASTDWAARGRIAIRSGSDGGQGSLYWEQQGEQASIQLSGPFGAGAWEIRWDPWQLTVSSRDGEVAHQLSGPDAAERFLFEQLGWWFPALAARYWLRGLADPGTGAVQVFDERGRLAVLEQHGWEVRYDEYQGDELLLLPRRLTMENERARVRIVIDRWQL